MACVMAGNQPIIRKCHSESEIWREFEHCQQVASTQISANAALPLSTVSGLPYSTDTFEITWGIQTDESQQFWNRRIVHPRSNPISVHSAAVALYSACLPHSLALYKTSQQCEDSKVIKTKTLLCTFDGELREGGERRR